MIVRKGARWHRLTGNVFVVAMLNLSASGAYLGFMKNQTLNAMMGILTFYLLATAWITARRREGETGVFDFAALIVPLAVGVFLLVYGFEAAHSQTGIKGGYPAAAYFIFGSMGLLLGAGDVRMIVRGGVSGSRRIARHLLRMCLGLFIAAGSFFLGQQQVFPVSIRKTHLLFIPAILPLILLFYWLIRVRSRNASGFELRGSSGVR